MINIWKTSKDYIAIISNKSDSKIVVYVGVAALFSYAFFWLSYLPLSRTAESLLVLVSIYIFLKKTSNYSLLIKETMGRILLFWLIVLLANYVSNFDYYTQILPEQITEARHYSKLFLFFIVAWWLSGNHSASILLLCLAALGFVIGTFITEDNYLNEIKKYFFDENRIDFGYKNAQHTAIYAAFSFIVLIAFYERILSSTKKYKAVAAVIIFVLQLYIVFILFAVETRATMFGLIVAYTSYAFYLYFTFKDQRANLTKKIALALFTLFIVLMLLPQFNINPLQKITNRILSEKDIIENIYKGDFDNIRTSSLGIRILSWKYAINELEKNPIIGFGPASRRIIPSSKLKEIDAISDNVINLNHFHNSYIELLFAYGICGLIVLLSLIMYIAHGVIQARRQGIMDDDIFMFVYVFSIYWLFVNLFDSYIIYSTGYYINTLLGAVAFTFYLQYKYKNNEKTTNTSAN